MSFKDIFLALMAIGQWSIIVCAIVMQDIVRNISVIV